MSKVIVGTDGSECSRRALRWAVEEARLRACPVHVVYAVDWRALNEAIFISPSQKEVDEEAQSVLDRVVGELGDVSDVALETRVMHLKDRHGPSAVMLDAADEEGDIVVVGTRGSGAVKGALIGSISHRLLHFAHCPVVVIP